MGLHDPGSFDAAPHQALELASARALANGDAATAFRLADRRCRIRPLPESHSYVLRAEALHGLGELAAALEDLATALAIAPDDIAANRRMLAWGRGRARTNAARTLVALDRDPRVLRQAISLLRAGGETGLAALHRRGDVVEGWAVWPRSDRESDRILGPKSVLAADLLHLVHTGEFGVIKTTVAPDPAHPLAGTELAAAGFRLKLRHSSSPQWIDVEYSAQPMASLRTCAEAPASPVRPVRRRRGESAAVSVIVPVYGDYRATRACLDSLLSEVTAESPHRVIVVDDASPDPRIAAMLRRIARRPRVTLLENTRNLGFVGAVNRALEESGKDDVILLNADTLVPPGFIDRLAAAARSADDIGTVTPLSNNGEFTSFPVANQSNPLGSAAEVAALDRVAAAVNGGVVVDLPNGIGFCLYIRRDCLDAVGGLSENYHRGYLEDVDLCLRARRHGFRNVCAASVFVGHAGSRSFGKDKRALVVRNLSVIAQKFPAYRDECADFLLADPLRAARQALESALPPPAANATLLVTMAGVVADIAAARARHLTDKGTRALSLTVRCRPDGPRADLRDGAGGIPQAAEVELASRSGLAQIQALLQATAVTRVELFDVARLPPGLLERLLDLKVPYDVVVAHDKLTATAGDRRILDGADRLLAPNARAEAAARRLDLTRPVVRLDFGPAAAMPIVAAAPAPARRLALVPVRRDAPEIAMMRQIIAALRQARPTLDLVVMADCEACAAVEGIFVTGPIEPAGLAEALRLHEIDRAMICLRRPLFGHPVTAALEAAALPLAIPDWSGGRGRRGNADLTFEPGMAADLLMPRLLRWLDGETG